MTLAPVLATKLQIPRSPPKTVARTRLIERLNEGLDRKLTLVSAPAGFGKTTLVSAWAAGSGRQVAWLSLDDGDSDEARFLNYLVAALRTILPSLGESVLLALRSPQPPQTEALLTNLLNDIVASSADNFVLVLDDYHAIDAKSVDAGLTFLIEHLPPQMRLVIATREDPQLPLARLRGRGELSELRVTDLRFTPSEAAGFLNQAMGLNLSAEHVAMLEGRTEGWIAGLQLAALSLQQRTDVSSFIESFSGSHHFVLDYLLEEVLQRQPENVQTFLLRTSILHQLSGSLCDAILQQPPVSGQATLEHLERANLFLVPLDSERRWYRYHHLFADLLRQRLQQTVASQDDLSELHRRASQWYEDHGLEVEAFQHAAAANDVERAERLIDGQGVPLQFRGAAAPVLKWLDSLPTTVLDDRPSLWVTYATALFFSGRHTAVEQKLQAAEAALGVMKQDVRTRDLVGRIASIRATLAIMQRDRETIIAQSRRALKHLHPDNLPIRTTATYTLGYAHQIQGDRAAASEAYAEVLRISASFGDSIYSIAATLGSAQIQESDTQLVPATQTYERVLQLIGDPPRGMASEAHIGLARISYEWNDLTGAEEHAKQCAELTRQMDSSDTFVSYAVFLARLRLARADVAGAVSILDEAEAFARQHNFLFRMPDIAAVQVLTLLRHDRLEAAAEIAHAYDLPVSQARVDLARGDATAALEALEPSQKQVEAMGWRDRQLELRIVQSLALQSHGNTVAAVQVLVDALGQGEPGRYVRTFVDEGRPMAALLSAAAANGAMPEYIAKLRAVFGDAVPTPHASPLIEPLSQRELEVLQLITQGLTNQEIGQRLVLALDTVKGHNRKIFGKLQVQRRTEAVARARELGLT